MKADWNSMLVQGKLCMKLVYDNMKIGAIVSWYKMLLSNCARPREKMIFWLACHNRLAAKNRLVKLGLLNDSKCIFCGKEETIQHLFFECDEIRKVWCSIVHWIQVHHYPK